MLSWTKRKQVNETSVIEITKCLHCAALGSTLLHSSDYCRTNWWTSHYDVYHFGSVSVHSGNKIIKERINNVFLFLFAVENNKNVVFYRIFFINCLFVSFLCVLLQPQQRKRETRYEETSYKEFPAAAQMPYQLNPSSTCQLNSRQLKNNQ